MEIGLPEVAIVFLVMLLLFGPGRIKNLGGELGEGIRKFRDGLQGTGEEQEAPAKDQTK